MTDEVERIMVKPIHAHEFTIRMARPISEPDDFSDEFQLFAGAGPRDTIKLQVVSGGGSVDTCHMIRKAIDECEAHVTGWIGPTCASAAGAIILACDDWEVDELSSLMVHTASYSTGWGKAQDVIASATHQDKMVNRFLRSTYTGFLTEEEILQVIDGKEFWFEGEDLANRLTAYAEYREMKRKEGMEGLMQQVAELEKTIEQLTNKRDV